MCAYVFVCLSNGNYVGTCMYCTKWTCTYAVCQQQPFVYCRLHTEQAGNDTCSELPTVSMK